MLRGVRGRKVVEGKWEEGKRGGRVRAEGRKVGHMRVSEERGRYGE